MESQMMPALGLVLGLVAVWGLSVLFSKIWNLGARQGQTKLEQEVEEWKRMYEQERMMRLENDNQVLARVLTTVNAQPLQTQSWWSGRANAATNTINKH